MITFEQFVNRQALEPMIQEAAMIIARLGIPPDLLDEMLEEELILAEAAATSYQVPAAASGATPHQGTTGIGTTIQNAGGGLLRGLKRFGSGMMNTFKNAFGADLTGQYNSAYRALDKFADSMRQVKSYERQSQILSKMVADLKGFETIAQKAQQERENQTVSQQMHQKTTAGTDPAAQFVKQAPPVTAKPAPAPTP